MDHVNGLDHLILQRQSPQSPQTSRAPHRRSVRKLILLPPTTPLNPARKHNVLVNATIASAEEAFLPRPNHTRLTPPLSAEENRDSKTITGTNAGGDLQSAPISVVESASTVINVVADGRGPGVTVGTEVEWHVIATP